MSRESTLWMDDLADYMDEQFIKNAFKASGEENILSVRVMKNRYTGHFAGYCLVHFRSNEAAVNAMDLCNGKLIPKSQPPIKYKLNFSHVGSFDNLNPTGSTEFLLWVGDLTPEVDDQAVYKAFATRYDSIKSANVIFEKGVSKGFAFVRFSNEDEYKDALVHMNGFRKLGSKPLKVSYAVPKKQNQNENMQQGNKDEYNNKYYNQYYNYDWYSGQNSAKPEFVTGFGNYTMSLTEEQKKQDTETDFELIEWNVPLDVDKVNSEYIQEQEEIWTTLEKVRWDLYNDLVNEENKLCARPRTDS